MTTLTGVAIIDAWPMVTGQKIQMVVQLIVDCDDDLAGAFCAAAKVADIIIQDQRRSEGKGDIAAQSQYRFDDIFA